MRKRLIVLVLNLAMVISVSLAAGTTGANARVADGLYGGADNAANLALQAQSSAASQANQSGPSSLTDWPLLSHDLQRTNYSPHENIISKDNVHLLQPLWQKPIYRGTGVPASSPVVYQGKVYLGSSTYDPNEPNFFAFDAATGSQLWQAKLGHGQENCFGSGVGSTAAVANNVVSVGGGDTGFYGLNALTGQQLWRHEISGPLVGRYYPWKSPLIYTPPASAVSYTYVGVASACDNPQVPGELRSLNLNTGQLEARLPTVPPGYRGGTVWTPAALSPDGSRLVFTTGEDMGWQGEYVRGIVSADPITLQVDQWNQQGDPAEDADWGTGPTIFTAGATSTMQMVGAVQKDYNPYPLPHTGYFHAYDLGKISDGPVWSYEIGHHVGANAAYDPTINGGTLFVPKTYGDDSRIYAFDPATGDLRTQYANNPLILEPWAIYGQIVLANGLLFVNNNNNDANGPKGSVKIYDASNFELLRTLTPYQPEGNHTGVTVSGGRIYWVSGSYLRAWGLPPNP